MDGALLLRRLHVRLARRLSGRSLWAVLLSALTLLACVATLRTRRDSTLAEGAGPRPAGARLGARVDFATLPVFLINGPEDYAARKWAEEQLALLGVRSYERLNGVIVEADDCLRLAGEGCQQGLALGHLAAWRRIAERRLPAALVLEDDVVWHRDFAALLPRYLAQVPSDWQAIWLGQMPRDDPPGVQPRDAAADALATVPATAPWTLHAYLLTADAAELLATHYDFLLARGGSPHATAPYPFARPDEIEALPFALSYRELKSDYFTAVALHYFVPSADRHKWVALRSTPAVPATLGRRTWVASQDIELGRGARTRCTCEALGNADVCSAADLARLPVMGTGLAYQNLCRLRRWALHNWLGQPAAAKPPTCAALRLRIRPAPESDTAPHDCLDDVWPPFPKSTTPKEAVGGGNLP